MENGYLARVWKVWNSHTLLLGMWNGRREFYHWTTNALPRNVKWYSWSENSSMVCQKGKHRTIIQSSNSTARYTPQLVKSGIQINFCTWMFIAVSFIIAKKWKQPTCSSMDDDGEKNCGISILWSILSIKSKWSVVTCHNIDGPWKHCASERS